MATDLPDVISLEDYRFEPKCVIKYSGIYLPLRSSLAYLVRSSDRKPYNITLILTPISDLSLGTPVLVINDPSLPLGSSLDAVLSANGSDVSLKFGHIVGFEDNFNDSGLLLVAVSGKTTAIHASCLAIS